MNFVFNENKTLSVSMKSYLEEAIRDSNLTVVQPTASPASKGLLEVDETSSPLPETNSEVFHSVVACTFLYSLVPIFFKPSVFSVPALQHRQYLFHNWTPFSI
jgi:hypothetical protein